MSARYPEKDPCTAIHCSILRAYHGRSILITGGRGYIGSALVQSLAGINCKLILLDQSPCDAWQPEGAKAEILLSNGNVSLRNTWDDILPGVDYVFHLAAREYLFPRSEYDPERDFQFNALPVLHLLEVCRIRNYRPGIVFASSANLFGMADTLPVTEDNGDAPSTVWSIHKLTAERYFQLYSRQFDINAITLRLGNVYGPTPRRSVKTRVVINRIIARALNGETVSTYANQGCVRDYVFLKDVVQAFLLAGAYCGSNKIPFYVIGSGEGETIRDVWHLIADSVKLHTGKNVPIRCDESVKIEPIEWRSFVADTTRFWKLSGWKPRTKLVQGIHSTVNAFLKESRRLQ